MRIVLAIAAIFATLSAAQASSLSCPASVDGDSDGEGGQSTHEFRHVSFFDGDPAEMADLAPEDSSGSATLEQLWRIRRSEGRPVTMVCRYHGTGQTVEKEVPSDVKECRLQGFLNGEGEVVGSPTLSCD